MVWRMRENHETHDDDREENNPFQDGHYHLNIACELDSLYDNEANEREPERGDTRDPVDVVHEFRFHNQERGVRGGNHGGNHEDAAQDEKSPAGEKSKCLPKNHSHPRV